MKESRKVFYGTVTFFLVCFIVFLLIYSITEPWKSRVSTRIATLDAAYDVNQTVYQIGAESIYSKEIPMKISFVTYLPEKQEIQFGYRIRSNKDDAISAYSFRIRNQDGIDTQKEDVRLESSMAYPAYTIVPESGLFHFYARIIVPIYKEEFLDFSQLYIDVYQDDEFITSIQVMESKDDLKEIIYDYSTNHYEYADSPLSSSAK